MDLNASPLPEEDEQPYEEHLEGEIIHEEIIESAVATMRREREERWQERPPLKGFTKEIHDAVESSVEDKSLSALCDAMNSHLTKSWACHLELMARLPHMTTTFQEMQAQVVAISARLQEKEKELEMAQADAAIYHSKSLRFEADLQSQARELEDLRQQAAEVEGLRAKTTEAEELRAKLLEAEHTQIAQAASEATRHEELAAQAEIAKVELASYQAGEEGRWAKRKKAFLASEEFSDILGARTVDLLDIGYEGAIRHFKEADYPPEGASLEFLDLQRLIDETSDSTLGELPK